MIVDPEFERERQTIQTRLGDDKKLATLTSEWVSLAQTRQYSYNFDWLGLPIIQYPQDMVAMQEIIWRVQPNVIVETGIARGGSAIFYASLLELIATCGGGEGQVIGVDIDIREHNRRAIVSHPLSKRVTLIEGSSTAQDVIELVQAEIPNGSRVLVCLDSNHTHDHVLDELRAYGPMVSDDSYMIVFDTLIEDLAPEAIGERSWGPGNNPHTAVQAFLNENTDFAIDAAIANKLQITVARDGFLKRLSQ